LMALLLLTDSRRDKRMDQRAGSPLLADQDRYVGQGAAIAPRIRRGDQRAARRTAGRFALRPR